MIKLKRVFALSSLLFVAASVCAQSDMDERKLRFGLTAAPNLGWIRPNMNGFGDIGWQPKLGFGYGAMMDYKFSESPNYLFSTGFNVTTTGGRMVEPWDSIVTEIGDTTSTLYLGKLNRSYRLGYVNVPLLLKMRTNEIGYMTYFGAIGFDLGIRARTRANDKYDWKGGVGPKNVDDVNINNRINFLRLALNISAGAEYNLSGNTNIYVGLGWHNTFTNLFNKSLDNRILVADENGNPKLDAIGLPITGNQKKALTNYVSLDLGVFF